MPKASAAQTPRPPGMVLAIIARILRRPEIMAFLPALSLAAYWLGGEPSLIVVALSLPVAYLALGVARQRARASADHGPALRESRRARLVSRLDAQLTEAAPDGPPTACIVLWLDDPAADETPPDEETAAALPDKFAERLTDCLRDGDGVFPLESGRFAVALAPARRIDLQAVLGLVSRLQSALAEPFSVNGQRILVSASAGFCLSGRAPLSAGAALLEAAEIAAADARQNGPGAIRAYSSQLRRHRRDHTQLRAELEKALNEGQIVPHFQPQIVTETGDISGFEALARWHHPSRGVIAPAEFLPLIEQTGLSERLGEVILFRSMTALTGWDACGADVPSVAVNFSLDQLRNPRLADLLQWELDRFELVPARLSVEILETVVTDTDNDVVVNNIARLAEMGCGIDLDDFGTGHSSIASIRRFAVRRIKIDRSFITGIDTDPGQRRMVGAILSMAQELDLETLAEGVETVGEHATLARLGCGHIQGFEVARPMPFADTVDWLTHYRHRRTQLPRLGRHAV